MTISSTGNRASFTGTGVTGPFAFSYPLLSEDDLVVLSVLDSTGVATTLVLNTDYTLAGDVDSVGRYNSGVDITTTTAVAVGRTLVAYRDPAITQPLDLVENDALPAEQLEKALDRATLVQQRHSDLLDRSVKLPDGYSGGADPTLPTPAGGYTFGWNAAADALVNIALSVGTSLVDLAAAGGSALIGFIQSGTGAVLRTLQAKLRDQVSVKDFGAVGDGVTADKAAIDLALASGHKRIHFPAGTYLYAGQFTKPDGVNIIGDGMGASTLYITYAGYGVLIKGTYGSIKDMTVSCSLQGIQFSNAVNTLYNMCDRVKLIGRTGRSATFASRATHGVTFSDMGSFAVFFNTLRDCYITGFDIGVTFDAPNGSPSTGGNANHVLDCQLENYWIGYEFRAVECDVKGGFQHSASGNSTADYTIAYRITNGANLNTIHPAMGEPGLFAKCLEADAGTTNNAILGEPNNYSMANTDAGTNEYNVSYTIQQSYQSFTENHYYTIPLTEAWGTNYRAAKFTLLYAADASAINGASAGSADITIYRVAGAPVAVIENHRRSGTGKSITFAGVWISATVAYLVFYAENNATASSAANVTVQINGADRGAALTLSESATDAGTSDPSSYKPLAASATWNPASVADKSSTTTTVAVAGAVVGDFVKAGFSLSLAGMTLTGYVSAADTVTAVLMNNTGGAVDLASGTLYVECERPSV